MMTSCQKINKTQLPRLSFKLLLIIYICLNGTTPFCPHALFVSTNSKSTVSAMRGIAFDWARYDPTQAHVYSVEAFSKKLVDLGVEHEAEEYLGDPWNKNWTVNGRFFSRVVPFLNRNLVFND